MKQLKLKRLFVLDCRLNEKILLKTKSSPKAISTLLCASVFIAPDIILLHQQCTQKQNPDQNHVQPASHWQSPPPISIDIIQTHINLCEMIYIYCWALSHLKTYLLPPHQLSGLGLRGGEMMERGEDVVLLRLVTFLSHLFPWYCPLSRSRGGATHTTPSFTSSDSCIVR